MYDVSHIAACGKNVDSNVKKKPSDLASTHSLSLSIRKTVHLETFNDDDDDRLELLRHPRAIPSGFEIVKEFVEVPRDFLFLQRWSLVSSFKWIRDEGILILEARSALYAARDACVRVREPSRILLLLDNFCLVLALDNGRSSHNFTLNSILRKFFGLQVLYVHTFHFRWIPSELNSSDAGSRFFSLLSMCMTIRPRHELHLSTVKHKHLIARATNRTHSGAGFCSPCVCLRTMKSSRRRASPTARAS